MPPSLTASTHMTLTFDLENLMNNCDKFHLNNSTKYRDIASRETGVNRRMDELLKT